MEASEDENVPIGDRFGTFIKTLLDKCDTSSKKKLIDFVNLWTPQANTFLNVLNENALLKSNLKTAETERNEFEKLSEELSFLLFQYRQRIDLLDETMMVYKTGTHHSTNNEDNQIEPGSLTDGDLGPLLTPPPPSSPHFRDDYIPEANNSNTFFSCNDTPDSSFSSEPQASSTKKKFGYGYGIKVCLPNREDRVLGKSSQCQNDYDSEEDNSNKILCDKSSGFSSALENRSTTACKAPKKNVTWEPDINIFLPNRNSHIPDRPVKSKKKLSSSRTSNSRKRYQCNECGNGYTLKKNLRRHIQAVHEGRVFQCIICNNVYQNNYSVIRHIKKAHRR